MTSKNSDIIIIAVINGGRNISSLPSPYLCIHLLYECTSSPLHLPHLFPLFKAKHTYKHNSFLCVSLPPSVEIDGLTTREETAPVLPPPPPSPALKSHQHVSGRLNNAHSSLT